MDELTLLINNGATGVDRTRSNLLDGLISPEIEIIQEQQRTTTEGPLYRVIIHNDDVTPMEFVLQILINVFRLAGAHALQVMYIAHFHGSAYVQTLPKLEAQKRVGLAHFSARLNGYPLEFSLKPESSGR